jgi:hypothetical protein
VQALGLIPINTHIMKIVTSQVSRKKKRKSGERIKEKDGG